MLQEHPKRPGSTLGAYETAWERLGSVRNGLGVPWELSKKPGAPWEHLKQFKGTSGASKTVRGSLGRCPKQPGAPQEHPKGPGGILGAAERDCWAPRKRMKRPGEPWECPKWARGASGTSETARGRFGSIQNGLGVP